MKKWIPVSAVCIVFTYTKTNAQQVTADVLEPAAIAGSYAHTWAEPAANSWATPDMADVANAVVDTVVQALDGTAADSLCCAAIANAAAINGQIALLYRGSCNYSEKALFCQQAGARAVVVINNIPGAAVPMGGGAVGQQVTIPVFQITQADGAAWRAQLDAGATVVAFLGNKTGYFADDVGFKKQGMLMPNGLNYPALLAGNSSEYSVQLGAWVYNFGQQPRTGVTLTATVDQGGPLLYNETSAGVDIAAGDSSFIALPDFSQNSYGGDYDFNYSTAFGGTDQSTGDNGFAVTLRMGEEFGYAPWDDATDRPIVTTGTQPAAPAGAYTSCAHFQDANASRIGVAGMHIYAAKNAPGNMLGELLTLSVFEWQDQFTGLSDGAFAFDNIIPVSETEYNVTVDSNIFIGYVPMEDPIVLQDDMRYLFCVTAFNNDIFLGYNENVNYDQNELTLDQPTTPNQNGTSWFVGFVGGPVATITARTVPAASIGIDEAGPSQQFGAYPNPSSGLFAMDLGTNGPVDITVTDATGRIVRTERANAQLHILDLRNEAQGIYAVELRSAQSRSIGRVVVER